MVENGTLGSFFGNLNTILEKKTQITRLLMINKCLKVTSVN